MSADLLRRAAALMRERAEAATPGPWVVYSDATVRAWADDDYRDVAYPDTAPQQNGDHISSWHPLVALAVADALDTAGADLWAHGPLCCPDGCSECDDDLWAPHVRRALAIARAYVGEAP